MKREERLESRGVYWASRIADWLCMAQTLCRDAKFHGGFDINGSILSKIFLANANEA
jgi:hypothetical protein